MTRWLHFVNLNFSLGMLERRGEKNRLGKNGAGSQASRQKLVIVDDTPPTAAKAKGCC